MSDFKNNRLISFLVIAIVYILAAVGGIFTYVSLDLAPWLSLLIADTAATVITFFFSCILKNASVYDPYWSVQPPVILALFAVAHGVNAFGALILFVVCFWGVRLTLNWAYTFKSLAHQDWRYTMLKEKTGVFYPIINFLGIHMVPTLIVYACTMPAVYAIINGLKLTFGGVSFLCVSLLAACMQGAADFQMHAFRKNKCAPFLEKGLWKYSRHPNYLGEILMWWGIALSVLSSAPGAWYLLVGALCNTLLFLFVSIPMADDRQARKEGFAEYKSRTRMLLPIKK